MTSGMRSGESERRADGWRADPASVRPTVLVLGGFLTSPPFYRRFRRRLRERGAAHVLVAGIWTPDWLLAGSRGLGPIVSRAARALIEAGRVSAASPASRGAPILLIGHSAGGVLGRILLAPRPFEGRPFGAAGRVAALVTLGSPLRPVPIAHHLGAAAAFAEEVSPGAFHAPRVGYVSVASAAVVGRSDGNGRERAAFRLYRSLAPDSSAGPEAGDGLVPLACALLPGANQVVVDCLHGQGSGGPWYGVEPAIDAWWPAALGAWREALLARAAAGASGDGSAGPARAGERQR